VTAVLVDTHIWAWTMIGGGRARLSRTAHTALDAIDEVVVSAVSFYEIAQKVRLGKWPEMEPLVDRLSDLLAEQGGRATPLTADIATAAGLMQWDHRDPFDRLLAATAIHLNLPLVSADSTFDGVVTRIW